MALKESQQDGLAVGLWQTSGRFGKLLGDFSASCQVCSSRQVSVFGNCRLTAGATRLRPYAPCGKAPRNRREPRPAGRRWHRRTLERSDDGVLHQVVGRVTFPQQRARQAGEPRQVRRIDLEVCHAPTKEFPRLQETRTREQKNSAGLRSNAAASPHISPATQASACEWPADKEDDGGPRRRVCGPVEQTSVFRRADRRSPQRGQQATPAV